MIDAERDVDLIMVPDVAVGDYVVVHSGYAIEVIPSDRALETMRLLGLEERRDPGPAASGARVLDEETIAADGPSPHLPPPPMRKIDG
jgi:hydrogenase expression/formation protein HypC